MQFIRFDEYLGVSRITGPRHNLLQIRIGTERQVTPVCERLPPIGTCEHEPLIEQELIAQVIDGVSEANRRLGSNYSVTHLRYVANDTKPEAVYALLALKIIERYAGGEEFLLPEK